MRSSMFKMNREYIVFTQSKYLVGLCNIDNQMHDHAQASIFFHSLSFFTYFEWILVFFFLYSWSMKQFISNRLHFIRINVFRKKKYMRKRKYNFHSISDWRISRQINGKCLHTFCCLFEMYKYAAKAICLRSIHFNPGKMLCN